MLQTSTSSEFDHVRTYRYRFRGRAVATSAKTNLAAVTEDAGDAGDSIPITALTQFSVTFDGET